MLERHLIAAERHVALGLQKVARQREIVAALANTAGQTTATARTMLATFEQLQAFHEADRDRLSRLVSSSSQ